MVGLSQIAGLASAAMSGTQGSAGTAASVPFAGVLQAVVEQAGTLQAKATSTVGGLLSGQGVEVHDAMIATQKADMAFELALAVRNKAVGAYQQMMQMQF